MILSIPYHRLSNCRMCMDHRPRCSTGWFKNVECEWRVCVSSTNALVMF